MYVYFPNAFPDRPSCLAFVCRVRRVASRIPTSFLVSRAAASAAPRTRSRRFENRSPRTACVCRLYSIFFFLHLLSGFSSTFITRNKCARRRLDRVRRRCTRASYFRLRSLYYNIYAHLHSCSGTVLLFVSPPPAATLLFVRSVVRVNPTGASA